MSRPEKSGIDYYPRDVGLCRDRKFRRLRLEYGYIAVAVYESLLDMIYADKGYYLPFGPGDRADVVWEVMADLQGPGQPTNETVEGIIAELAVSGLFDQQLLESRQMLTSRRIQETYYRATVERKAVVVNPDVWLLSVEEMRLLSVRSSILRFFEDNRLDNGDHLPVHVQDRPSGTQRKEKERENSIPEKTSQTPSAQWPREKSEKILIELPLIDHTLWPVTEAMAERWAQLYQAVDVPAELRKMRGWLDANQKNRKTRNGIERYIVRWLGRAQDQAARVSRKATPEGSRMEVIV